MVIVSIDIKVKCYASSLINKIIFHLLFFTGKKTTRGNLKPVLNVELLLIYYTRAHFQQFILKSKYL